MVIFIAPLTGGYSEALSQTKAHSGCCVNHSRTYV